MPEVGSSYAVDGVRASILHATAVGGLAGSLPCCANNKVTPSANSPPPASGHGWPKADPSGRLLDRSHTTMLLGDWLVPTLDPPQVTRRRPSGVKASPFTGA